LIHLMHMIQMPNTVVMKNANDINQLNKDSFHSKALPVKIY
jgi:hypothetical protein